MGVLGKKRGRGGATAELLAFYGKRTINEKSQQTACIVIKYYGQNYLICGILIISRIRIYIFYCHLHERHVDIYSVSPKKTTTNLLSNISVNINRF